MPEFCFSICDSCVGCLTWLFEKSSLPDEWKGVRLTLFWALNFILITVNLIVDWIVFIGTLSDSVSVEPKLNCSTTTTTGMSFCNANVIRVSSCVFLAFALAVTLLYPLQLLCGICELLRKQKYNPSFHMFMEILTLLLETAGMPILLLAAIYVLSLDKNFGPWSSFHWELYAFPIVSMLCLTWKIVKFTRLGLCCCACSALYGATWPIQKRVRNTNKNLMNNMLQWLPYESYSKNWLVACRWCFFSFFSVPLILAGYLACSLIIALTAARRNFMV